MMLENDRNANILYAFHKYNKTSVAAFTNMV